MSTPTQVVVAPPHRDWAPRFDAERAILARAIGPGVVAVHHIGSTAIPGIWAKPILDVLVVVADLDAVDARTPELERLGYAALGEFGIPGRRFFRRSDAAGVRLGHVHLFAEGSAQVERHLAFRDFMRAHPECARRYSDLKRGLAAAHPDDIAAYMDGKDAFIRDVDRRAAAWSEEADT